MSKALKDSIKKTKKGKLYIHNGIKTLDEENKKIADKGGSIFDQYYYDEDDYKKPWDF